MAIAQIDQIEIAYDTFGDATDPALLLIMGLGVQMIAWPDEICMELADFGFYVIRFDNRDSGLSTNYDDYGLPDLLAGFAGDASSAPYLLSDMAKDCIDLLGYLGVTQAHVVGVSMGGMIAQQAVIDFPDRFLSLCSIMSTTGSKEVGQPSPEAVNALLQPMAQDKESAIARSVGTSRVIASPKYFDPDRARDLAVRSYERNHNPDGVARQLMAILVSPDRTSELQKVKIPTLVIHGQLDPLVDLSGGIATANAIPNARLMIIEDMGHDIPIELWPIVRDAIVAHVNVSLRD